ncbi:hypothetical protein HYH03_011600 [Edaphochlamys debaryana]|uniref:Uncharacterized protein n=1 Tax=Edaphochlamys debaryana TaxID=47281 RepID=A0A836BUV5_9CHLO|nr:hypothetical protein HYH03_011600 [Edaphochlamys debaryana]|eukprot:KAG2489971.1 hypothetical protein HYH03_011600 [Edaphochlamys debaryana]
MEEQVEQHNGGLCRAYSAPLSVALGERDSFAPVTPPGLLQQLLQGGLELSPLASPGIATRDDAGLSADPTARALPLGGDRQAPAGPRDAPNTSRGLLSQAFARRGPVRPQLKCDEDVGPSRARPWPRAQEPSDGLLEDPARSSSSGSEGLLTVTVLLQTSGGAAAADVVAPETVPLVGVGRAASPSSCPAADGPDSVPTHISSLDHSAAASPLRLQPYDLGRSRLWRAAQPRGRPPLPRMRRVPRYLSIAPTVSSDLFPLSAHDPAPPAAATVSTSGGASASPLRSTGGSPFGSLLPICAGAWGCTSASASASTNTGTGTGGQGFNSAADADGCVCWGGSAWTQRTSPFAQLAALAEGGAEGDGDVEAGALGAALVRPSSPGPGPLVAGGSAGAGGCGCGAGGGSAGVQQQPSAPAMSDDELDDYYIQTFCGGVDPLEALMREEASRELPGGAALDVEQHASQELAASPDAVTLRDPRHDSRPAHAHSHGHGHGPEPRAQHAATRVPEAAAEVEAVAVVEPPPYELAARQEAAWEAGGGAQSPSHSPSRHGAPRPEVDASAAFLEPAPEAEPAAEPPQPQLPQQEEEELELELFPPPPPQPSPRPHGGGGGSALLRADTAAPFSLPPVLDGATGLHGFAAAAHDDGMLFELELEPGSVAVQDERMPYGTCHGRQPEQPQPWRPRAVASLPPLRLASPADCTVAAAATAAAVAVIGPATPDPSAAVLSCAADADAAAAVPDEDCIMVEASLVVVPAAPCPAGSGHPSPVSPACPHCAGSNDAMHGTLWPHASCSSHEASAPMSGSPSALAAGPCEGPQPASTECHVRLRAACCYHHAMVELHPSHKQLLLRCIEEQIGPLASPRAAAASTPASTPAAADVDAGAYRPGSPAPAPAPGGPQPGSEPGAHHGGSQAASGGEGDGWGLGLGPGLDFGLGLGLGLGSPSASAAAGGAAAAPVVSPSACPSAFAAAAAAELASVSTALGGPGPAPQGQLVVSLDRVESCAHCSVAREVRSMVRQAVWMNCFRTDSLELGSSPRALGSSPCGCAVRSPAAAGAVPATRQMAV